MRKMNENDLKYIISRLVNLANDAIEESRKNKNDLFYRGKKLAYYEMISTIRNQLYIDDIDLKEFGLDFDPDRIF